MRSSKWFCIVPLALLIGLVCQPLWPDPPKGHDWLLHFYRIPVVSSMWQSGVLFSRWQPDLVLGYGSPLFLFYPPGSAYLLTALYWLTGQNAPLAYTLSFAVALALATVGMFLLGRALYGGWGAWVAAIAYTLSPHLLYQTYERGSLSNALAMGLFPWALWGMVQLAKRPFPKWVVLTAVFLCLIFLSHAAASLIFAPFLLLTAISYQLSAISSQQSTASDPRSSLLTPHSSLLLGLCLAAFSWLPGLAEFSATRYQASAQTVDFHDYFASPLLAWPSTMVAELHNAPLPKSAGAGLVLLAVGGVTTTLWQSWRKKPDWFELMLIGAGGGLLFLTTASSAWVWEHVTPLQNFQFPWRLLDIPVLCLALLAAKGITAVSPKWQFPLTAAATLLLFANALPYLYPPRLNNLPTHLSLADTSQAQQQWNIWGLTAWGEYSATAVTEWPDSPPFLQADQGATLGQKLQPITGATTITSTPWQAEIALNLLQAANLVFYTHYFPGWQARLVSVPSDQYSVLSGGEGIAVEADENGRISIPVPAGEHTLFVYWGRTPVRWLADGLSLVALVVLIGVVWRGVRNKERGVKSEKQNLLSATCHLPLSLLFLLLFIGKAAWVDRFDTPLVVHAQNGRISTTTQPAWGNFNNQLQLTGYDLQPDGLLTLYWHTQQDSLPLYHVVINLVDARGIPAKTITNPLPGTTPTNFWEAGQLTRDVYELPIRLGQRPIGYQVSVALVDPQTNQAVPLVDAPAGQIEIPLGRLKLPPPETAESTTAFLVQFGDGIQLQDVSLPAQVKAGETAEITLFWHVLAPLPTDYTIFIHLLNPDGTLAAANDGPPVNGFYPTSYWEIGEYIRDEHPWQAALPPGRYQVQLGLYRPDTGERLPTNNELRDRIIVGQIEVTD